MDRTCRIAIKCPGPQPGLEADSPVTNYSSEYTDGVDFPGFKFPPYRPYDPGRPGWWSTDACGGAFRCISYLSQEDADDCAAALALACVYTPPSPPTTPQICVVNPPACTSVSPELFPNQTQTASFTCPDGSIFTWTVNSGTVYSTSPAMANSVALAMAQQRVAMYYICLPALSSNPCYGSFYSVSLDILGMDLPFTVDIIDGSLPAGISPIMSDFNTFGFQGIASELGAFQFTVRVTSGSGHTVDKTYTMYVIGIVNDSVLTEGVIGQAYNESLTGEGGTAPYTFEVTTGTLPPGLIMDTAGQITGTPTEVGNTSFTVEVTDSAGFSCSKEFSIAVTCLISTASLPNGTDGQAYSQTLTVNGFTGAVTWSIIAGALPSGLSLNSSTGEISGTTDTVETQAFTVQAQQGEFSCEKDLSIQVEAASTPLDWSLLTWTNPQQNTAGPGFTNTVLNPNVNPTTQNLFQGAAQANTAINFVPTTAQVINTGSLSYNGPLVACTLNATGGQIYPVDGFGSQGNWICRVWGDHFAVISIGGGAGDNNYPFNIPDTGGIPQNIYVEFEVNAISMEAALLVNAYIQGIFS